jgi:hypothetical protein
MEENITRPCLTEASIQTLDHIFSAVDPLELRENLLELYHGYLIHAAGNLPENFESIARNLHHVISCLPDVKRE